MSRELSDKGMLLEYPQVDFQKIEGIIEALFEWMNLVEDCQVQYLDWKIEKKKILKNEKLKFGSYCY